MSCRRNNYRHTISCENCDYCERCNEEYIEKKKLIGKPVLTLKQVLTFMKNNETK